MQQIECKSWKSARTNSRQFSLRSLIVTTTIIAIAIANPGLAIFMPFSVGLLLLVAILIILVGSVQVILADDRKAVFRYVWKNLKCVIIATICSIAYFTYALMIFDSIWPSD